MASFANSKGGYIIFGINDAREIKGLNDKSLKNFNDLRVEIYTGFLNNHFAPEITWKHKIINYKEKKLGIIYTYELKNKPAICKKNLDNADPKYSLKEGDIYYRYIGSSEKIRYPELNDIIESLRKNEQQLWMETIKKIAKIGVENTGILDTQTGLIENKNGIIQITEDQLSKLKFIKEGQFAKKEGAPVIKLVADAKLINSIKTIKTNITHYDIVEVFLRNQNVDNPLSYISSIFNCQSVFYPIYFYMEKANINVKDTIDFINKAKLRSSAKAKLISRLNDQNSKYTPPSTSISITSKMKNKALNEYLTQNVPEIIPENEIKYYINSIRSMTKQQIIENREYIGEKLLLFYNKFYTENTKLSLINAIRYSICWIDEALYKPIY